MKTKYSKSLDDIKVESLQRLNQNNSDKFQDQAKSSSALKLAPTRASCLLCGDKLQGSKFSHRDVLFINCKKCGHIQTAAIPPSGYPYSEESAAFNTIYPDLDIKEYKDRVDRIYQPKLDWIKRDLEERFSSEELKSKKWIELGCGAGYFLSCLSRSGFKQITGYDTDPELVKRANSVLPNFVKVHHGSESLDDTLANSSADIYAAFFVLEHVLNPNAFYKQLSLLPANTIFIFSVPVFGFSCLLEGVFDRLYARNLDAVVHTQVYTEKSIDYALNMADFDIISQWIFGQDAEDFSRFVLDSLQEKYPNDMFQEISAQLLDLQDSLQHVLDKNHMSDQRHIIAIKR